MDQLNKSKALGKGFSPSFVEKSGIQKAIVRKIRVLAIKCRIVKNVMF